MRVLKHKHTSLVLIIIAIILFLLIQINYSASSPSISLFNLFPVIYSGLSLPYVKWSWSPSIDNIGMRAFEMLLLFALLIISSFQKKRLLKLIIYGVFIVYWLFLLFAYSDQISARVFFLSSIPFLLTMLLLCYTTLKKPSQL